MTKQFTQKEIAALIEQSNADTGLAPIDFKRDKNGTPYKDVYENIALALERLGFTIRKNDFKLCYEIKGTIKGQPYDGEIDDEIANRIRFQINEEFRFQPSKGGFLDVISDIAFRNSYHPVKDYLGGLHWDGIKRIGTFLSTHGGAEDTELNRAFSTIWFVAAVRRIMEPGCKFDTLLMWESRQGLNKSSALEILAVKQDWFTSCLPLGSEAKMVIEQTAGTWIVEFPEMTGHNNDIEKIKAFASQRIDKSRLAYGHFATTRPRQWVGCISKNPGAKLQDVENRRFWPVGAGTFNLNMIKRDRDQLWAEAVELEKSGFSITLDQSLWAAAREVQNSQRVDNPFEDKLRDNLALNIAGNTVTLADLGDWASWVTIKDIWETLGVHDDADGLIKRDKYKGKMADAMQRLGFMHRRQAARSHPVLKRDEYYYEHGDSDLEEVTRLRGLVPQG